MEKKSYILLSCSNQSLKDTLLSLFPFKSGSIEEGFSYLGFLLKPNSYGPKDWEWILNTTIRKINSLSFRYISLCGRLILVSSVLQGIHVYWMSLFSIPSSTL